MANLRSIGVVLRIVAALTLLVVFAYGTDWLLRAENFPVRQVRFEGPFKYVSHAELERAVLDLMRGNFFLVDLEAVKRRVEKLPWVHRAAVRRQFPHDIAIQFTEQRLAARWGDGAWVNTNGEVVRVSGEGLPDDMPQLDGPDGTAAQVLAAYRDFGAAVEPLGMTVARVQLAPRRSWRVELTGADGEPLAIVLDHEQPRARLERFAQVYRSALASHASAIRQVDLRYTNGFAVEWHHEGGRSRVAHTAAPRNEG